MISKKYLMLYMWIAIVINGYSYTTIVDNGFKKLPLVFLAALLVFSGVIFGSMIKSILKNTVDSSREFELALIGSMLGLSIITLILMLSAFSICLLKSAPPVEVQLYFALSVLESIVTLFYVYLIKKVKTAMKGEAYDLQSNN